MFSFFLIFHLYVQPVPEGYVPLLSEVPNLKLNCFFSTWASSGELLGEKAMGSCCPGELSAASL